MSRVIAVLAKSPRAVVSAGIRGGKGDSGQIGPAFKVDATGPTADRALYDASPEGFSFLDTTTGLLYFRQGAGWSAGTQFQGPQGIQGLPGNNGVDGASGAPGAPGADGAAASDAIPQPLGVASAGVSPASSRADHIHAKPAPADIGAATSAQGAKADSAVQPGALAAVATSGAYGDLSGKPAIPSTAAAVGAIPAADKGAANGVATLDAGGKLPLAQVPATAITDTSVVASQAAMLALTAQPGDVAIRTDISTSFILRVEPATTLSNWQEILAPSSGGGAAVGSSTPQALGTASPGVSASASRQDHVHAMPAAADVGAAAAAHGHSEVVAGGAPGFMTGTQAAKLAGITAGATANADTDSLPEGATNKWFTAARVIASVLTGLSVVTGGAVVSTDSVLVGIGKLQKQLTDLISTVGGKQDTLVSGTNIKTVNGSSLLGSGDLSVTAASAATVTDSTTARTLALADAGKYIRHTNASASTVTVPLQSSVAWAADTEVHIRRAGAGSLTISPAAGVTLNAPSGGTLVMTDRMSVTLKRVASDAWDVIGQTVAA